MNISRREDGYAMVAAVASIAVFAVLALAVMAVARGAITTGEAEVGQARAAAAADAGIALALHGLLAADMASRWSIDGRERAMRFEEARLLIRVEDERGKIPLNRIDEEYVTNMLTVLGVADAQAKILRDSFLDWTDEDDEARPDGAEAEYYGKRGISPRNGALQSIDELTEIRGFTPALVDRIGRIATVSSGPASFDPQCAQPLAIATMTSGGMDSPAVLERMRELAGQRPAIELADRRSLNGRPLMIDVRATLTGGAQAHRRIIVELSKGPNHPYVVRSFD